MVISIHGIYIAKCKQITHFSNFQRNGVMQFFTFNHRGYFGVYIGENMAPVTIWKEYELDLNIICSLCRRMRKLMMKSMVRLYCMQRKIKYPWEEIIERIKRY